MNYALWCRRTAKPWLLYSHGLSKEEAQRKAQLMQRLNPNWEFKVSKKEPR